MKENKKHNTKEENSDDYLDKVWKNWSSRRRCEKTHKPNYIKPKNQEDSNNI